MPDLAYVLGVALVYTSATLYLAFLLLRRQEPGPGPAPEPEAEWEPVAQARARVRDRARRQAVATARAEMASGVDYDWPAAAHGPESGHEVMRRRFRRNHALSPESR